MPVEESVDKHINLIKLCVGAESVDDLLSWQASPRSWGPDGTPRHVTRRWPKRQEEILKGGSIYWVFKGLVLCRQLILRLDEVIGSDGIKRCGIVLGPDVELTQPTPRRPFQGWRYLPQSDAPIDIPKENKNDIPLPPQLAAALAEIGVR
jgi:hypothetical protein